MPYMSSAFSFIYTHGQSCDRCAAVAIVHGYRLTHGFFPTSVIWIPAPQVDPMAGFIG